MSFPSDTAAHLFFLRQALQQRDFALALEILPYLLWSMIQASAAAFASQALTYLEVAQLLLTGRFPTLLDNRLHQEAFETVGLSLFLLSLLASLSIRIAARVRQRRLRAREWQLPPPPPQ